MKVAYLTNQYPKVSHSFIRREIAGIEARGIEVMRYALRPIDASQLHDPADVAESKKTRAILGVGAGGLIGATGWAKLTRMSRYLKAFAAAYRMGRRSEVGVIRHMIYLMEACVLTRWCEQDGVDHVHVHFGTNPTTIAFLAHLLGGSSYSFTVHGPEEFDHPQALSLGDKIEHAAFVVGVSSFGRSQLFRWCGHEHWPKVHEVHCGVDESFLQSEAEPNASNRLVCIGRLCEQKGQLLLIEAAHRLHDEGVDFELVLVGDGELRGEIERLVDRYGLKERVTITGWQSGNEVIEHLKNGRAMVLPSFAEGLPVAIMEALALGRPVISTYIAGIPELLNRGCGWVIPAGSIDDLVETMREALACEPEELARMGAAGARRVELRHDASVEAGKLAALFESQGTTGGTA